MGGAGRSGATTLEDFFGCGYAVGIGTRPKGGFGLTFDLCAHVGGLSQADADSLIAKAHEICPYSDATRNNNTVALRASVS